MRYGRGYGGADDWPGVEAPGVEVPGGVLHSVDGDTTRLHAIGEEWRVDGTAANAAAILPALDGDSRFADAHFLAATSRYREGCNTYESFSLAFRAKPGA